MALKVFYSHNILIIKLFMIALGWFYNFDRINSTTALIASFAAGLSLKIKSVILFKYNFYIEFKYLLNRFIRKIIKNNY